MLVCHIKECVYYIIGRSRAVNEKEIIVVDAVLQKVFLVVLLLIQPDDPGNAKLLKYLDVLLGVVTVSLVRVPLLYGTHEGHELAGDDPVDVAVLDTLVVLILLYIESAEIVPLELDGVFEAL